MEITSLQQLKHWNDFPTKEAPIVLEWFLDWFFEELLEKNKISEAIEAREALIQFGMIAEKVSKKKLQIELIIIYPIILDMVI